MNSFNFTNNPNNKPKLSYSRSLQPSQSYFAGNKKYVRNELQNNNNNPQEKKNDYIKPNSMSLILKNTNNETNKIDLKNESNTNPINITKPIINSKPQIFKGTSNNKKLINLRGESYIKVGEGNKLVKKGEMIEQSKSILKNELNSNQERTIQIGENVYKEKGKKLIKIDPNNPVDTSKKQKMKKKKRKAEYFPNKSLNKNDLKRSLTIEGVGYIKKGKSLIIKRKNLSKRFLNKKDKKKDKGQQYCMFFLKFGKCNQGEQCPYIHDKDKVSICGNFIKGKCFNKSCLLSHTLDKEKMPVCKFFLEGTCNNDNCIYSHVYVHPEAKVCSNFLRGYCPLGSQCKKKHTYICQDFLKNNLCPRGDSCRLYHPNPEKKRKTDDSNDSSSKRVKLDENVVDPHDYELVFGDYSPLEDDSDNDDDDDSSQDDCNSDSDSDDNSSSGSSVVQRKNDPNFVSNDRIDQFLNNISH
eukprot:TRINITY_DN2947_c0_g1_i1.p1 TRINITY_DN2947_c0_g1~~TRINITY_DN2947_c0_g1_i1.p1  ORF type:complete len:468 (+),score=140.97 TRINITY_DN2947_c0_g1_i1:26-1429(+)